MRLFSTMIGLALLATMGLPDSPALAQADEPPTTLPVNAVAYRAIPPGAVFLVQPQSASKLDEDAQAEIVARLPALGFSSAEEADLVLTVETQLSDRLGDFGSPFNYEEKSAGVKAGGNIFSTDGGSLLNPGIPAPKSNRIFRIVVSVYDRATGLYLWQGSIERADASAEPTQALDFMVPELLKYIGVNAAPPAP